MVWRKMESKRFWICTKNAGHYSKLRDFYACTPEIFAPHHGVRELVEWMEMTLSSALTISVSSGSMHWTTPEVEVFTS